jgi:predicted DNA-binding protein
MKRKKAISVTVPYELAEALEKMGKKQGVTTSFLVSEAVKTYCDKKVLEEMRKDFSAHAAKMGIFTEEDIERVIHEFREEEKAGKYSR